VTNAVETAAKMIEQIATGSAKNPTTLIILYARFRWHRKANGMQ